MPFLLPQVILTSFIYNYIFKLAAGNHFTLFFVLILVNKTKSKWLWFNLLQDTKPLRKSNINQKLICVHWTVCLFVNAITFKYVVTSWNFVKIYNISHISPRHCTEPNVDRTQNIEVLLNLLPNYSISSRDKIMIMQNAEIILFVIL